MCLCIRKAKKSSFSAVAYVLPSAPRHTRKFSAIFRAIVSVGEAKKKVYFSALLSFRPHSSCVCAARTPARVFFISFYSWFDSRNSRKRIVYATDRMLYKIRHLKQHTTDTLAQYIYAAFFLRVLCVPTHTKNSLFRSLSIAEKIY